MAVVVYDVRIKSPEKDDEMHFDVFFQGERKNQRKAEALVKSYCESIGMSVDMSQADVWFCHVQEHPMPMNKANAGIIQFMD